MTDTDHFVEFERVQKSYDGEVLVVKDLNLAMPKGEFLTMLGPSGSGKTTCLMMLAGFETATHGDIRLGGRSINNIPPHKRGIGMVFQNYALFPHMRFGEEVASARFDEEAALWRVRTVQGEELAADVLISSVGQLNRPHVPEIPGLDRFRGPLFHSARWDHDVPIAGRRVAVIGNAASAIQFIPEIAREAARVEIFQRSANWMIPRLDRAYTEEEKRRFTRFPLLAKLYRWWIWLQHELRFPAFRRNAFVSRRLARMAERSMRAQISSPELQQALQALRKDPVVFCELQRVEMQFV